MLKIQIIQEGRAKILVPKTEKISKEMPVFYNPVMKFNRDISVLLLNSVENKNMHIADPLAGTGIRSMRFLLELEKGKMGDIKINDISKAAEKLIKRNLKLNKINKKIKVSNKEANMFMLENYGFDYIDIDPFGYPGLFLDSAVRKLSRNGILAVTATDTAALSGTSPKACLRKYWARPLRNEFMHETGLRILIRFVQLNGAKYDKSLIPLFSYSKEHYMRAFFVNRKGNAGKILKEHGYVLWCRKCLERKVSKEIFNTDRCGCGNKYEYAGPLWLGNLWDSDVLKRMIKNNKEEEHQNFLRLIKEESQIKSVGFCNIHKICSNYGLNVPKTSELVKKIKTKKRVSLTHFSPLGIRTAIKVKELVKLIKAIQSPFSRQ